MSSSTQQFKSETTNSLSKKPVVLQFRDRVVVTMTNQTTYPMTLLKSKIWSGKRDTITIFPDEIAPNESGSFTHFGNQYFGARGAVVYAGRNATAVPCAWLLAWDAPACLTSDTPNRVYVDCGPEEVIDRIEWIQIETELQSSPKTNFDDDKATRTTVTAKFDDKIVDPATLASVFGIM